MAIGPLYWDEIIAEDHDDKHWADPRVPSGGRRHPGHGNDNDDGESDEDLWGGENLPGKDKGRKSWKGRGKVTEDKKGNGKEMGKGNGQGNEKGIVEQTPGADDISRAFACSCRRQCMRQTQTWRAN